MEGEKGWEGSHVLFILNQVLCSTPWAFHLRSTRSQVVDSVAFGTYAIVRQYGIWLVVVRRFKTRAPNPRDLIRFMIDDSYKALVQGITHSVRAN